MNITRKLLEALGVSTCEHHGDTYSLKSRLIRWAAAKLLTPLVGYADLIVCVNYEAGGGGDWVTVEAIEDYCHELTLFVGTNPAKVEAEAREAEERERFIAEYEPTEAEVAEAEKGEAIVAEYCRLKKISPESVNP